MGVAPKVIDERTHFRTEMSSQMEDSILWVCSATRLSCHDTGDRGSCRRRGRLLHLCGDLGARCSHWLGYHSPCLFSLLVPFLSRRHSNGDDATEATDASRLVVFAFVFLLLEFGFVEAIIGFECAGELRLQT